VARSPIARFLRSGAARGFGAGCGCCRRPGTAIIRTIGSEDRRRGRNGPILNVLCFATPPAEIRHSYATELAVCAQRARSAPSVTSTRSGPLWGALDFSAPRGEGPIRIPNSATIELRRLVGDRARMASPPVVGDKQRNRHGRPRRRTGRPQTPESSATKPVRKSHILLSVAVLEEETARACKPVRLARFHEPCNATKASPLYAGREIAPLRRRPNAPAARNGAGAKHVRHGDFARQIRTFALVVGVRIGADNIPRPAVKGRRSLDAGRHSPAARSSAENVALVDGAPRARRFSGLDGQSGAIAKGRRRRPGRGFHQDRRRARRRRGFPLRPMSRRRACFASKAASSAAGGASISLRIVRARADRDEHRLAIGGKDRFAASNDRRRPAATARWFGRARRREIAVTCRESGRLSRWTRHKHKWGSAPADRRRCRTAA